MAVFVKRAAGASAVKPHGFASVWAKTASGAKCLFTGFSWFDRLVALPDMTTPRGAHAASSDGSGCVLFAGGVGRNGTDAGTERYSPTGAHTLLAPLSGKGTDFVGGMDGAGNALFFGGSGYSPNKLLTVEQYDPAGVHSTLANLPHAMDNCAGTASANGYVYAAGGLSLGTWYKDAYRICGGVRTTLSQLSEAKRFLAAAPDGAGNVYFAGGATTDDCCVATVDRYSASGVRSTVTSLSKARMEFAGARAGNNAIFAGGEDYDGAKLDLVEMYTPSGTRTTLASLPVPVSRLTAATNGAGVAVFFGGHKATSPRAVASVVGYTQDGTQVVYPDMSTGRYDSAAAMAGNGAVFIAGGYVTGNGTTPAEAYMK